jgi:hypothetical protein
MRRLIAVPMRARHSAVDIAAKMLARYAITAQSSNPVRDDQFVAICSPCGEGVVQARDLLSACCRRCPV